MLMILVPRTVIGEVVPVSGMGNTSTGTPPSTSAIVASVISRSCWSGAIVQSTVLKTGRSPERAAGHRLEDLEQRFHVRHLADLVLEMPG